MLQDTCSIQIVSLTLVRTLTMGYSKAAVPKPSGRPICLIAIRLIICPPEATASSCASVTSAGPRVKCETREGRSIHTSMGQGPSTGQRPLQALPHMMTHPMHIACMPFDHLRAHAYLGIGMGE